MKITCLLESEWSGSKIYVLRLGLTTFQYLVLYDGKLYQDRYEVAWWYCWRYPLYLLGLVKDVLPQNLANLLQERTLSSACRTINRLKSDAYAASVR